MITHQITATPTRTGWWVLESDNGAVSQVRRLDRAADEMREAVAYLDGVPEGDMDLHVTTVLPDEFTQARSEAKVLSDQLSLLQKQVAAANRHAANSLAKMGLSVRDIGALMEVSPQRVSQLLNNQSPHSRSSTTAARSEKRAITDGHSQGRATRARTIKTPRTKSATN